MSETKHDQGKTRDHSIRMAVVTSLFSKFGTVILRLVSIPVAIRLLGMEEFGVYAAITMVVGMIDMLHVGIGPALMHEISKAVAKGDRERERSVFATGILLSGGLTVTVAIALGLLLLFVPIPTLFGQSFAPFADSMERACWIAIVLISITLIGAVIEKTRDGYLETRINNAWGAAGNILGAAALLAGVWFFPTIEFLVLAINGTMALAKLANTVHLLSVRRYLWPRLSAFRWFLLRPLIANGARFSVTSLSALVEYNAIAYMVGRYSGPAAAGIFAVMVTVHFSLTNILGTVTLPTWPALVDAHARGDTRWFRITARRLLLLGPAFALAVGVGLAVVGPWALPMWAGEEFHLSRAGIIAFSCYFLLHIWRHVNQVLLYGLGKVGATVWVILAESALMLGLAVAVARQGTDLTAVYAVMAIALAMMSGWVFPVMYFREMRRIGSGESGGQHRQFQPSTAELSEEMV